MSNKDAYQQKLEAKLDEWRAEIDKLRAKGRQADADAQIQLDRQVEDLEKRQEAARRKLEELRSTSEDAWQDLKSGIEKAWDDLGNAVRSAVDRYR
jgi:hypothetical protein